MFKFAILIAASLLLSQATAEPIRLEERQILSSITSDFGDGTSGIVSVATGVASGATSLAGDITSLGDGIVEEVTLTGGAGDVTSIGGHAYTFATGAAASAATGASNAGLTQYDASPIFASMLTLVIGAIAGAFVTL
ncbi:hypothetical protein BT96DRAFT_970865 [Gymnopus androsaceus JB14]|uniref:Uncharacterized protein n=1 Tax=Gymnopus androsaceus JB14 TaxID=1447944 RepID=A0A6A4IDZ1_9AGAR|nr:hypothetical protein BT96DRAFT_970865 [Gymnopus androsaceus JB14]